MGKLNFLSSWTEGVSEFFSKRSAQSYMNKPEMAMVSASCGSSCGAGDKEAEQKPTACGSACGAGDKEEQKKPSACGSACGAGDK